MIFFFTYFRFCKPDNSGGRGSCFQNAAAKDKHLDTRVSFSSSQFSIVPIVWLLLLCQFICRLIFYFARKWSWNVQVKMKGSTRHTKKSVSALIHVAIRNYIDWLTLIIVIRKTFKRQPVKIDLTMNGNNFFFSISFLIPSLTEHLFSVCFPSGFFFLFRKSPLIKVLHFQFVRLCKTLEFFLLLFVCTFSFRIHKIKGKTRKLQWLNPTKTT